MKRLICAAVLMACIGCAQNADEFRAAAPSRQDLGVKVPSGAQALTGDLGEMKGALGARAELYGLTVGVSDIVNGALVWVKVLVETIISFEPTTLTADTAVWGPYTEPLKPDTWRFTVKRDGTGFTYAFEGKPKSAGDEAFVTVISGRHEPGTQRVGAGHFLIDWDEAQHLADKPKEVGRAGFSYTRNSDDDVEITTEFQQVRDGETGQLVDATYAYAQPSSGPGRFEFVIHKDLENNHSALERLAVISRWQEDGSGRGDLSASGGDLATELTATECWDSAFLRTHYRDSANWKPAEGDAASCVF